MASGSRPPEVKPPVEVPTPPPPPSLRRTGANGSAPESARSPLSGAVSWKHSEGTVVVTGSGRLVPVMLAGNFGQKLRNRLRDRSESTATSVGQSVYDEEEFATSQGWVLKKPSKYNGRKDWKQLQRENKLVRQWCVTDRDVLKFYTTDQACVTETPQCINLKTVKRIFSGDANLRAVDAGAADKCPDAIYIEAGEHSIIVQFEDVHGARDRSLELWLRVMPESALAEDWAEGQQVRPLMASDDIWLAEVAPKLALPRQRTRPRELSLLVPPFVCPALPLSSQRIASDCFGLLWMASDCF